MSNQILLKIAYENGSVKNYLPAMHASIFIEEQISHLHSFITSVIESGKKTVSIEMLGDDSKIFKATIFLEKIIDIQISLADGKHRTERYNAELSLAKLPDTGGKPVN